MPEYIKAPFNFVPLNKEVYYPDWSEQVSQDVPFSDGESGEITLTIKAESPIFVRNGHTKKEADLATGKITTENNEELEQAKEKYFSFSHYKYIDNENIEQKQYFIPGTTIKGMIRSVLEIMSFSELKMYNDNKFAFREMTTDYLNRMNNIQCGWLRKNNDNYEIMRLGNPMRISIDDIDKTLSLDSKLSNFIRHANFKDDINRLAKKKYELINQTNGNERNNNNLKIHFTYTPNEIKSVQNIVKVDDNKTSSETGVIVLTGQPGARNDTEHKGKLFEFVFVNKEDAIYEVISDKIIKQFYFTHRDSKDFTDFRLKHIDENKEIPVFFSVNSQNQIVDLGLTYMYKLPYKFSVGELIKQKINLNKTDLADSIFGCANSKRKSLKGRVQFSNANLINKNGEDPQLNPNSPVEMVLSSPKASYFPLYLEQPTYLQLKDGNKTINKYNTYNDTTNILGWKRYPIHPNTESIDSFDNEEIKTKLIPLKEKSTFYSKIKIHNLKEIEIGALLSAIELHGNNDYYNHSIGQAKPYGYGRICIKCELHGLKHKKYDYMQSFEDQMNKFIKEKTNSEEQDPWLTSLHLTELAAMTYCKHKNEDKLLLQYMKMSKNRNDNEFVQAKGPQKHSLKEFLERFSQISQYDKAWQPISSIKEKAENMETLQNNELAELENLNDFITGKRIVENYFEANNKTISEAAENKLYIFVKNCIKRKNRRWLNKDEKDWNLVKKWIGDSKVEEWYNNIDSENLLEQ